MRFIVDVNLSRRVDVWQSEEFEFVADINDEWKDTEIWNYAKENGLTIITKDTDFANRILVSEMPPKIIHLRIGNMLLGALFLS